MTNILYPLSETMDFSYLCDKEHGKSSLLCEMNGSFHSALGFSYLCIQMVLNKTGFFEFTKNNQYEKNYFSDGLSAVLFDGRCTKHESGARQEW